MRRTGLFLAILQLVLLSACSGQSKELVMQPDVTVQSSEYSVGYGFTAASGVQMWVGMFMEEVSDALGAPRSVQTSESCAFGGMDRAYDYEGFQICTNDESGREQIYEITLTDNTHGTQEGIYIGADMAEVSAVYGPSQIPGGSLLSYSKDGMRLMFMIRDGKVSAIRYTAL